MTDTAPRALRRDERGNRAHRRYGGERENRPDSTLPGNSSLILASFLHRPIASKVEQQHPLKGPRHASGGEREPEEEEAEAEEEEEEDDDSLIDSTKKPYRKQKL